MLIAVVTRGATTEVRLTSSEFARGIIAQDTETTEAEDTEHSTDGAAEDGEHSSDGAESAEGHALECEFAPELNPQGELECGKGPSPILPELKEVGWGAGSFFVLAIFMVGFLVPKVMKGMKARYDHIESGKADADSMRAAARADVAQYDSSLATVKAEARERVEAARQQLEAERTAKLAEVNQAIAAKRDAANAEALAARHAVQDQVSSAVADVTGRTLELALGKAPDSSKVRTAVDSVMSTGVSS